MSSLSQLSDEIRKCSLCELCKNNPPDTTPVPGSGPHHGKLMIIGECPGIDEAYGGEPFIGRSGQLLRKVLKDYKIDPDHCYITNVAKCVSRKGGRNIPLPKGVQKTCADNWLKKEIEILKPFVIMPLGQTALSAILRLYPDQDIIGYATDVKLTTVVGQGSLLHISRKLRYNDSHSYVLPNLHPAFILRGNKDYFEVFKRQIEQVSIRLKNATYGAMEQS